MSAGARAMWFDKTNPAVTFLDIRESIKPHTTVWRPDFVCDTRAIPACVGQDYDLIVFDPPHCLMGANSRLGRRYGSFKETEIHDTIRGSARESHRISTPNALMVFKWAGDNVHSILKLMEPYWTPLLGHGVAKSCRRDLRGTHWILLTRTQC